MNTLRLALPSVLAGAVLFAESAEAQRLDPPATEADAVRMLASADYRERDEAMFWVLYRAGADEPIGPGLRAAMLRAASDPGWGDGRPEIDTDLNPDGWGELWSFYGDAVSRMRDPDAIPFMLARRGSPYDLAAIGRPAILPMIEALEDPEADTRHTVDVSLRGLTLMVHDGLPTEEERARIVAATRYWLGTDRLRLAVVMDALGLAVTLGTPDPLAIVERAATNRDVAAAMQENPTERFIDLIQADAREALRPGFVPYVIRFRRE